jgi:hypothetical protein
MDTTPGQNGPGLLQQQGPSHLPQQPSAVARTLALMSKASLMPILLVIVVCGLQAIMPAGSRPSDLIGAFHGGTTAATLNAERQAQVNTAQQMADAQARAAIETETARQQQAAILASLQAKQDMANIADFACTGGQIAAAFMSPDDAETARQASQAACNKAAELRQEIMTAQTQAAQDGAIMPRQPSD